MLFTNSLFDMPWYISVIGLIFCLESICLMLTALVVLLAPLRWQHSQAFCCLFGWLHMLRTSSWLLMEWEKYLVDFSSPSCEFFLTNLLSLLNLAFSTFFLPIERFYLLNVSTFWTFLPFERSTFWTFYLLNFYLLNVLPSERSTFCNSTFCRSARIRINI